MIRHNPRSEPKFHHAEILIGVGRSTTASFAIFRRGWVFRRFVIRSVAVKLSDDSGFPNIFLGESPSEDYDLHHNYVLIWFGSRTGSSCCQPLPLFWGFWAGHSCGDGLRGLGRTRGEFSFFNFVFNLLRGNIGCFCILRSTCCGAFSRDLVQLARFRANSIVLTFFFGSCLKQLKGVGHE